MTAQDLNTLLAKQAIRDLLSDYCRAMDRMDRDLALSIWHPQATCEYIDMYTGSGSGFVDWVWSAHAGMLRHSHQITNVSSKIDADGARAVSEAYVTVVLWTQPASAPTEVISRGRYLDRWSRRDGRWAIEQRLYVQDLLTQTALPPTSLAACAAASSRDRKDPSYGWLAAFDGNA
jgi:hypothetical protein